MDTRTPTDTSSETPADKIRNRAYQLYQARGRVDGREQEDWLQAEQEVMQAAAEEETQQHGQRTQDRSFGSKPEFLAAEEVGDERPRGTNGRQKSNHSPGESRRPHRP